MAKSTWFEVDKKGLEKLMSRRHKSFIVHELISNSWDQNDATRVDVELTPIANTPKVFLRVTDDDPNGFKDLTHAFTLFAESEKKSNPQQRGRFNLGEKFVLACCETATIRTTTGAVLFDASGVRKNIRKKTDKGSIFEAVLKMTREEFEEVCKSVGLLIPPSDIITTFAGKQLEIRTPITSFTATLATEISDDEGNLKRTIRKTIVNVYKPKEGEVAHIYEMGIPVVETDGAFHIDVQQKVPLNIDRDNVTPSYLKAIRTFVFNHTFDIIKEEDINDVWIKEATSDERCTDEAITKSLDLRFGKKRVSFDPSDPEANKIAVSQGYTVVHGKSLSSDEWKNVKRAGAVLPAGQVTPSNHITTSPDGAKPIPWDELTDKQKEVVEFTKEYALEIMHVKIGVEITRIPQKSIAWYGGKKMTYNLLRLGKKFFSNFPNNATEVIDLCIHEFGHEKSSDHLSREYYDALTDLGAKSTMFALHNPKFFKKHHIS